LASLSGSFRLRGITSHHREATARARGISRDAFLREYLIRNAPSSPSDPLSADEWEKAFDECFDSFPAIGPLPDHAFSRESLQQGRGGRCVLNS
jgi:hypothetical protein